MKDKDANRVSALRSVKTAIMETKTAPGVKKDLEDSDIIKIIQKLSKQRAEAHNEYKAAAERATNDADKERYLEALNKELSEGIVLDEYLPKMLSEEEVREVVDKTIAELDATTMKDMGKVMGTINKAYAGRVDGAVVSRIVKERLS